MTQKVSRRRRRRYSGTKRVASVSWETPLPKIATEWWAIIYALVDPFLRENANIVTHTGLNVKIERKDGTFTLSYNGRTYAQHEFVTFPHFITWIHDSLESIGRI